MPTMLSPSASRHDVTPCGVAGTGVRQLASAWLMLGLVACAGTPATEAPAAVEPVVATESSAAPTNPEPIRSDREFKLAVGQSVLVDNPYGSVYLRFGGYEHQLGLHSTLQQPDGAAAIAFAPRDRGAHFEIAPRLPEGSMLARGQRLDLVIYVPESHAVRVRTESGVIESRGVRSELDLRSAAGDIAVRGGNGSVQAETGEGSIEVAFAHSAPPGSHQRLATRTGYIQVGVTDDLHAEVRLATSAPFTTDFSLSVSHRNGEEPNKTAVAVVGKPADGDQRAVLELSSLRGDIRLLRRAVYVDADAVAPSSVPSG